MKRFENKTAGIISSADLKTKKGKTVYWIMFSILIVICIASILPTVWVLLMGFKGTQEIYSGMTFFPKDISFVHIKQRVTETVAVMKFGRTLLNTIVLAMGSVIFELTSCGLGGYVISRLKPRGAKLIFMLVVWTMMLPHQIRTVPLFISYLSFPFIADIPGEVSLINTYWPIWLGAMANCFNVILFKNHFDSISTSLVEAAKIDGCGNGRIFFNIMVPLSKPIMLYVTIMTIKASWGAFFTGYLIWNEESVRTLPVQIYMMKSNPDVKLNTYMLALTLATLPMFILFAVFNKQIVTGVNIGGVKG